MASIFINYRRADNAAGYSRTLAQRLRREFGDDEVFRDIQSIPPGQEFADVIQTRLEGCAAMLVLIGTQWTRVTGTDGQRRLDDPQDWVRREVAAALQRDVLVVPVLVCGATLPTPAELPDDLKALTGRNAFTMSDDDFEHDLEQLVDALRKQLRLPTQAGAPRDRPPTVAETLGTLMRTIPEAARDLPPPRRPSLGQRLVRKLIGWLQFITFVAIAVWIGYTQSDAFAAGVNRFFVRSREMIQQLIQ